MVKSPKKKAGIIKLINSHKVLSILAVLALASAVSLAVISTTYYVGQQAALKDLSLVTTDLKIVYDRILSVNRDNLLRTDFRNDCSVGHPSWLEERIACGPSGEITLSKARDSIEDAALLLTQSTNGTLFKTDISNVEIGNDLAAITVPTNHNGVGCYISYGRNAQGSFWNYSFVCRKDVANILPGYEISE
jgi:hypothetical protein